MALGVSRLLLSLSAMKRAAGEAVIPADLLLTQAGDFIIAENGWVILANESDIPTTKPDISSYLKTEDGLDILLTQDDDVISTQQYRESAGEFYGDRDIITQDGESIYTQDGRSIQEDTPFIFNLLLTQDGDVISTQDSAPLTLQQNDLLIAARAKLITQYGIELRTQDGNDFLTEQIITTSAFEPPYVLEENDLVTQDGLLLTTEDGLAIQLQDVYIAA
jgi:flagellar basal body rod protein FlgG